MTIIIFFSNSYFFFQFLLFSQKIVHFMDSYKIWVPGQQASHPGFAGTRRFFAFTEVFKLLPALFVNMLPLLRLRYPVVKKTFMWMA